MVAVAVVMVVVVVAAVVYIVVAAVVCVVAGVADAVVVPGSCFVVSFRVWRLALRSLEGGANHHTPFFLSFDRVAAEAIDPRDRAANPARDGSSDCGRRRPRDRVVRLLVDFTVLCCSSALAVLGRRSSQFIFSEKIFFP